MEYRRLVFDCRGQVASAILEHLDREVLADPSGKRVVLVLEALRNLEGLPKELVTCLVDYFVARRMQASIVDPTGLAQDAYSRIGGNVLVEVCREESEVTVPREVLLVEDTEDSLQFMKALLRNVGHRVTCAMTGRDAIRQHEKARFDVVFLDLLLPDMDGIKVARRLAEERVPVIGMSAHLARWDAAQLRWAKFRRLLSKPITIHDLHAALRGL